MKKLTLNWTVSHTSDLSIAPKDKVAASVPGAVQLDYARAFEYAPYWYGLNFKQFDWMEDEYFIYEAILDFKCSPMECAVMHFEGIDYGYEIAVDGTLLAKGEGAFTPVKFDVTPYSGKKATLTVTVFPIPK